MPNVIPRSSAARFSIQWPLAVPLPSRCRSGDQLSDDLRVAQSGAGRPRSATGLSRAEQTELSAANKRIRELENKVAILKRARELLREPHDPKGDTQPSPPWPQKDCPCN